MLERNVSDEIGWLVNSALMLIDLHSQGKTRSSRNTNFLGINQDQMNSHEEKEDPDRIVRRRRALVVVVEVGGGGAAGGGDMAEEVGVEAEIPVIELPRTGTKLRGAITTGNEAMTRRWRGQAPHLHSEIVHWYAVELERRRDVIFVNGLSGCSEARSSKD